MNTDLLNLLTVNGYQFLRQLPATDEVAGVVRMAFTHALCVGLDEHSYRTRFCYPDRESAAAAILSWDGAGDPPGPWIKEKGGPNGDRMNPATFKGIPIAQVPW